MASVKTAKRIYKNPADATPLPLAEQPMPTDEEELFNANMVEEEPYFEQVD
jgi:hypothetical protein